MISVCLALTLHWAETGLLLRWARVPLLCPYFALGLGFVAYASAWVSNPWPFPCETSSFDIGRTLLVFAAHLGREARSLPPALRDASCRVSDTCRPRTGPDFAVHSMHRARVDSVTRPALAMRMLVSRSRLARVGPVMLSGRLMLRLRGFCCYARLSALGTIRGGTSESG